MRVYCDRDSRFVGTQTGYYLINSNIAYAYYVVPSTHRHIAISKIGRQPSDNITEILIKEKHQEQLWKQDMRMRCGQRPRDVESQRIIRVRQIDEEEAKKYRFDVYFIRQ
jgi:hypothetical protein